MPLDALCLQGLVHELKAGLEGGKIDKIYQPGRDEILLALRAPEGNARLLLSANPSHPRLQRTQLTRENPDTPPMFCMLLRKHLSGARLLDICQPPLERVVFLTFEVRNELGDRVSRKLVLEAIGRRSNLILLDEEDRILDCLRRVDSNLAEKSKEGERVLLPGFFYQLPPAVSKANPLSMDETSLDALLRQAPPQTQISAWLLDTFAGLSPLICRELAFRASGETDARLHQLTHEQQTKLIQAFLSVINDVKENRFIPTMLLQEGKPADFSFLPIGQYGRTRTSEVYPTFSLLLDRFYDQRERLERIRQRGQDLIRSVTNARDRTARKIGLQEQELAATRDRERLRQLGDILTSNLHHMTRGMPVLEAPDFYDPEGGLVRIPLNPLLTPQQNAAKYYKDYNKAKTAEEKLSEQLAKGRRELDYLSSVLEAIRLSEGERDLQEIRQELTDTGYLRRPAKAKGREKRVSSKPMEFRSSAGLRISVGKNNTQNDLLTCKQAFKSDYWFHTQKIHGSHVILWTQGAQPDPQSLTEAACLAAWFSQAQGGSKIPVDYTPVKFVKKPAGARPGMVIYTTYETTLVSPSEEMVNALRVK